MTFIYCTSFSDAQLIRFNKTYIDTFPTIRNIVKTDTGYVMLGGGYESNKLKIIIPFIDSLGNLQKTIRYGDNQYYYYHGVENSLAQNNNGKFSLAGGVDDGTNVGCLLMKFDINFDTLWSKTYLLDTISTFFYGGNQTIENEYILTGITREDENFQALDHSDILLLQTDSSGNMKWFKNYGGADADYGYKVLQTPDAGFLIGGWTRSFNLHVAQGYRGDWYLIKTDSLGNMEWDEHYGNPDYDDGRMGDLVINNNDNSYYMCGGYQIIDDGINDIQYGRIVKIDENFNINWDKYYYTEANKNETFIRMEPLINDNYMLLHSKVINSSYARSSLIKITAEGNILWQRQFNIPGSGNSTQFLLDVIQTSDNGFAAAGWAYGGSLNPYQQGWAVKTDSLGCDGVGSCSDTTMMFFLDVIPDTVCYEDTLIFRFFIKGRSAPYIIECSNGTTWDSIFYSNKLNPMIDTSFSYIHTVKDTTYNLDFTLIDPLGQTKTTSVSFYVKECENNILQQYLADKYIKIYPNPAKEIVNISIESSCLYFENGKIDLLDLQGKIVKSVSQNIDFSLNGNNIELELNGLRKGLYLLKVQGDNFVKTEKIIVK
ncbi:MAG: T9SS type A sorting domain-containing protein [Bacteroidota bacterium]